MPHPNDVRPDQLPPKAEWLRDILGDIPVRPPPDFSRPPPTPKPPEPRP